MNQDNERFSNLGLRGERKKTRKTNNPDAPDQSALSYRRFIENLPVMFYAAESTPPYAPIYVSPAFKKFGYPLKQWRENADWWVRVIHPDDCERVLEKTAAAMQAGAQTDYEYRIVARNGDIRWVRDRGSFVKDAAGSIICWQGIILDITDSKLAEQKLQKSENLYRTLAHSIPHTAVILFDRDCRYTLADGNLLEKHGFTKEMFEGKTLQEVFPPEVTDEWADYYRRALSGETISFESESAEGWFQVYVVPVKNEGGDIFAGMVMWQDVTAQKASESALRDSERRYRALHNKSLGLICTHDLTGRLLSVNPAAAKSFGYAAEDLVGKPLQSFVSPDVVPLFERYLELIATEGEFFGLFRILTKSGEERILRVSNTLYKENGKPTFVLGNAQDITTLKRTEGALRESEARYRDIFENANDLIYVHDLEGNYLSVNKAAERSFGYKLEEATKLNIKQIVAPEYLELARRNLHEKALGAKQAAYEVDCITKDGRRITLEINSQAIYQDGKPVAVQGIARDITERKQIEQIILRSEAEMQAIFSAMSDIVMVFDADGNYQRIARSNPQPSYQPAINLIGKNVHEILPPPLAEYFLENIRKALRTRQSIRIEYSLQTGDEERWFAAVVSPMMSDSAVVVARDITENKRAERALISREEQYRDLFENANDLIYTHDLRGKFTSLNRTGEIITGYSREEALRMNLGQVVAPEYLAAARAMIASKVGGEAATTYELEIIAKCGRRVPLELSTRIIYQNGKPVGIQGIARDITERRRSEEALKDSERRYRSLGEGIMHQVWTAQPDGALDYVNRRMLDYFGLTFEQLRNDGRSIIHPDDLSQTIERWDYSRKTGENFKTQFRLRKHDGEYRWYQARATVGRDADENVVKWYGTNTDINDQKIAEAKLNHIAGHDTLTNLPNRAKFMNLLARAADHAAQNAGGRFAVLFLDLDRFKIVNDSLGHTIGDKLLVAFAERITDCVRPNDIVARLGGDEFTILLNNINELTDAVRVADRLLENLAAPFKLDAYEVFTSASIGIIVSDETHRQPEDLLRDADTAMYRAKEAGKSRYEIFDREMHIRNMKLLQIETDLRRAIEQNEFKVFYQPLIELGTGEIREFEALIRWQHPQHGLVPPNDFIGIAEETGLIIPIGRWVLEEACRQTAEWQRLFAPHKNLSVSVNLSAKQLMHPNLIEQVGEILEKTEFNPRRLKLEVTESMVMENSEKALSVISELNKLGIQLSTDDFGTGYSSLSYLHRFPFNRLKVDRSFVSKMDSDPKSEAIVRTILLLAQNLNIEVVAEGIETSPQLRSLRQLGCRTGQGYLFSKPVAAETAARLLENGLQDGNVASIYEFSRTGDHQLLELDKIQ